MNPPACRLRLAAALLLAAAASGPAFGQLSQITSCVEVAPGGSSTRTGEGADCDPQAARSEAISDARREARDARAPVCIDDISAAEAQAACTAAGGLMPTSVGTSLSGPHFPSPGRTSVNTALPVSGGNAKLCVMMRDRPQDASTTTRDNLFCVFNGFRETLVDFPTNGRCGVQCFDTRRHELVVRRFETASLTGAEADAILADATSVLQTDDGVGDVACRVGLARLGQITTFSTGDGSLDTEAELAAVFALSGDVKVVEDINFCGTLGTGIIGCAPVGGETQVVVRFTPSLEGILWAHEFGHQQGLPHRSASTAIMNPFIGPDRRMVTSTECSAYQDLDGFDPGALTEGLDDLADTHEALDLRAFVRRVFVHGVPYAEASRYSPDEVLGLVGLLADEREQQHWSNVVALLGMSGDARAVAPLLQFIAAGPDALTPTHYRAKASAVASLGYLVNRTADDRALRYLREGTRPAVWSRRRVRGLGPQHATLAERDRDLAKHALIGLALSGHPEAGRELEALQDEAAVTAPDQFPAAMADVLQQTLREHDKIARQGLAEYYRGSR